MYLVKELWIYPVKSLGGFSVEKSYARYAGFEFDRRWMLVDESNQFITQRSHPKLCLFSTLIKNEGLHIFYDKEEIIIPLNDQSNNVIETKVWDDVAYVYEQDRHASQMISEILKFNIKLVKIRDEKSRIHYSETVSKTFQVSLADGYPDLLLSEQSLQYLNEHTRDNFSIKRFRPNIVITADHPHQEDDWKKIETENASFENVKPCSRCVMINIDPDSGSVRKEPLNLLSKYRKSGNHVYFGTNLACTKEGWVSKGESLKSE